MMNQYPIKLFLLVLISYASMSVKANGIGFYEQVNAGIEVSGSGSVTVTPDNFSLSLNITERGRVTSKLKALVDKKSNLVMQAAKNLGVKSANINSAQVNLRIIEEKPSITVQGLEFSKNNKGSVFIDGQDMTEQVKNNQQGNQKKALFELSRRIRVGFTNIDDYDQFLTQLVKINVSHISSLSMNITQRDKYYQQALLKAITQAKDKAQKMIQHSGGQLGKLIYLKEQSNGAYQPRYAQAMMSESSASNHSSLVGSQTIKASVLMKFALTK